MTLTRAFPRLLAGFAALALVVAGAPTLARIADTAGREERPLIAPALAATLAADEGPDLTVFVHADTTSDAVGASQAAGLRVIDTFDRIGVAVAAGPHDAVRAVADHDAVTYVEADEPVQLFMQTSHQATRGAEARTAFQHITRADRRVDAWKLGASAGPGPAYVGEVDGRGVTVAVIDTGVDGTHPMFTRDGVSKVRRNMKLACFNHPPGLRLPPDTCPGEEPNPFWVDMTARGNDTDTPSLGGHGTHVAGIVAGYDVTMSNGEPLHGAAPGADLVSLSMGQSLTVYGGAASMNWVLENHDTPCDGCWPIRVINNSWGSSGSHDPSSVLAKLQDALVGEGVVVVWAAGNSGGDGGSTALNPEAQSPTPGVLAVANYDDAGTGTREGSLAATSSRGQKGDPTTYPDLSAPGTSITSACRPHLTLCTTGSSYGTIGGTSMAAPHVAGIVAQILQVRPPFTPRGVEDLLEDTAHQFGFGAAYERDDPTRNDGFTSYDKGHGLVDATAAIARLLGVTDPAAAAECRAGTPVIVDPEGDARQLAINTPRPSETTLDITSADIDSSGHATFVIDVLDLEDGDPPGSTGIAFDWNLTRDDETWNLRSSRTAGTESHRLLVTTADGDEVTIEGLTGRFDAENDEVRVSVPSNVLTGADLPGLAAGQAFAELEIISWRIEGVLLAGVDVATSGCAHVIGAGTAPIPVDYIEPEPQPTPADADATLRDGGTFERDGSPPGTTNMYSCKGPNDPRCVTYLLHLRPSGGSGTLEIGISSDLYGTVLEDYDVYLYDLDGHELGVAGNPQTVAESAEVDIPESGLYYLVVQPFTATPDSTYTVTATLT